MEKFIKKNKSLLLYGVIVLLVLTFIGRSFADSFNELFDDYNLITLDVEVMSIKEEYDTYVMVFKEYPDVEYTIITDNYHIAKNNGFDDKVKVGEKITVRTFPQYTDSFKLIPVVSVVYNDEVLLNEEEGYANFLKMFTKE